MNTLLANMIKKTIADEDAMNAIFKKQVERYDFVNKHMTELIEEFTDPTEVDIAGKLRKEKGGAIIFNFGKYAGKTLSYIEANNPSYLDWILEHSHWPSGSKRALAYYRETERAGRTRGA